MREAWHLTWITFWMPYTDDLAGLRHCQHNLPCPQATKFIDFYTAQLVALKLRS